jgi:hypothetical protein
LKLEIHPQARQNYNSKAEELVTRLRSAPDRLKQQGGQPNPNIHSVHTFTPENITGEVGHSWTDFTGNVVAQAFSEGGQIIGLFDEDYVELKRITEGMQKSIIPRNVVSLQQLSDLLFAWVKEKYRGASLSTMTEHVLTECEKLIQEMEIWIPVSHLYIQAPFVFGKITFRAVTKTMVDEWEASLLSRAATPEEVESVRKGIERRRPQIQGLATATIKVAAEPKRAHEIAFAEVDRTVSILRLLSPANMHPAKVSYSAPLGSQHQDSYTYLLVEGGKIVGYTSGMVDKSRTEWNLSKEDLATWAPELSVLHTLLTKETLTDFQEALLDSLILYSRSSLAKQVSDKLVYMLIALESAFLKDSRTHPKTRLSVIRAHAR